MGDLLEETLRYAKEKRAAGMKQFMQFIKQVMTKQVTLPVWALLLLISACTYVLSPLDSIPDFLPVTGFLDDMLMVTSVLNTIKPFTKVRDNQSSTN